MKLKELILLTILSIYSIWGVSQTKFHDSNWDLQLGMLFGRSSFEGYNAMVDFGLEKKIHSFRLALETQSQVGYKYSGMFSSTGYANDKFHNAKLMYGVRLVRKILIAEINAGACGYYHKDLTIVNYSSGGGWFSFSGKGVEIKKYSGIGFTTSLSVGFILGNNKIIALEAGSTNTSEILLNTVGLKFLFIP